MELALGSVKTVADCDDPNTDACYFPQFNGARNIRDLTRDYIPAYKAYIANGGTVTEDQAALYQACVDMLARTVNDYENDMRLIEDFHDMLVAIGAMPKPDEPSGFSRFFNSSMEKGNSLIYRIFGAKGFLDFTK